MIAKIQPSKKGKSNPKRLAQYLTQESGFKAEGSVSSFTHLQGYLTGKYDAEQDRRLRGEVILSDNLAGLDTAAAEMEGVAALNPRCKDPIMHFELAWPHDERPTKSQWVDCAYQAIKALGFQEHQYLIVAHDDKKHFHIHVMVNKVHPETLRVNDPYQSHMLLHKTARALEAKYGWKHTPGLAKWDEERKKPIELPHHERHNYRNTNADIESLQVYIRKEIAPRLQQLLRQDKTTWQDVHRLLAQSHLQLEKSETGGYTVLAINHNIRVKASDVFRNNFAGKANRIRLEQQLGEWQNPEQNIAQHSTSGKEITVWGAGKRAGKRIYTGRDVQAEGGRTHPKRDEQKRAQRRAERMEAREALKAEYARYKEQQLMVCKRITEEGRKRRQSLTENLRARKKEIRGRALPWAAKKILISEAVAQSVIEMHAVKHAITESRRAHSPKDYRSWVADRAAEGDARAAAQLRGWYYQDQRKQRKITQRIEPDGFHLESPEEDIDKESNDWADFLNENIEQQREAIQQQLRATRIWQIDRRTGDVSYAVNGKVSIVDRGKILSVLNQDEAAIVLGLEMSIKKYGTRLTCTGSAEWKAAVARAVVRHGIYVQFTDPEIQRLIARQQRAAHPLQRQILRLASLKERITETENDRILFDNETDVYQLLSTVWPTGNAKQVLQVLRNSSEGTAQVNFGGIFTVQREYSQNHKPVWFVTLNNDKRDYISQQIEKALEGTRRAIDNNIRIRGREGIGR